MNEFVLVEFMCTQEESDELSRRIELLDKNFQFQRYDTSEEIDLEIGLCEQYVHIFGRINSESASFIRLQDDFLSQRMRISYIPDKLKNKYRNTK